MEILTGALAMLVAILIYDKFKRVKTKDTTSLEHKIKEKEISEHFDALLNYTPEQAYKKVK